MTTIFVTLMMGAVRTSEMSVHSNETTWYYAPEDRRLLNFRKQTCLLIGISVSADTNTKWKALLIETSLSTYGM
jgi:hypothetical protein